MAQSTRDPSREVLNSKAELNVVSRDWRNGDIASNDYRAFDSSIVDMLSYGVKDPTRGVRSLTCHVVRTCHVEQVCFSKELHTLTRLESRQSWDGPRITYPTAVSM